MIEMTVGLVVFLVVAGFGAYIFLMIYHPEWVGISGKETEKLLSEHQEGSVVDDSDFFQKPAKPEVTKPDGGGAS